MDAVLVVQQLINPLYRERELGPAWLEVPWLARVGQYRVASQCPVDSQTGAEEIRREVTEFSPRPSRLDLQP